MAYYETLPRGEPSGELLTQLEDFDRVCVDLAQTGVRTMSSGGFCPEEKRLLESMDENIEEVLADQVCVRLVTRNYAFVNE